MAWKLSQEIEKTIPKFCLEILESKGDDYTTQDRFKAIHYLMQMRLENARLAPAGAKSSQRPDQPRGVDRLSRLRVIG